MQGRSEQRPYELSLQKTVVYEIGVQTDFTSV
jgi:hypothetical protein